MKTRITELFGIEYPVIQGGMAGVSDADLAAAVSNAGGLGILNSVGPADQLRAAIARIRELTDRPFGVNVMLLMPNAAEIADLLIEEKVPVVTTGAGSPKQYMQKWKEAGLKVMPVVPSATVAKKMQDLGADAVVCSGTEAGGHIGEVTTMSMLPVAARLCSIPIVAAGGIGDGRGMAGAFALGAEGVQCGTAFIVADECNVSDGYKDAIVKAMESDTRVYRNPGTMRNVRSVTSPMLERYLEALKEQGYETAKTLLGGGMANAVKEGDPEKSTYLAGQSAGAVARRASCRDIIETMVREAREVALAQADKWQ
ncbi:MAG: enoyl-[acyl-carrier-protein] reductase FabK [Clostridiales bacterium]|nr:enoyl-[acyl-carrier-protein] reductase FabK [Clostridiales bacterium]